MPVSRHYFIRFTATASLLIGLVALLAIVAMTFWLGEKAQSYFDNVVAARDTRVAAVELRNAMQTAESSERGFIVMGNEIYLAPYQTAKIQTQRRLSALETLLPSYPNSDAALKRLSAILSSKLDEFDRTIDLKRNHHEEDALAIFRTNSGKALTDERMCFSRGSSGRRMKG